MDREQLLLIAEGGEAFYLAWRAQPLRKKIACGFAQSAKPLGVDPPLAAAVWLGWLARRRMAWPLMLVPAVMVATMRVGQTPMPPWSILLVAVVTFVAGWAVMRRGEKRYLQQRQRLYAVIDAWIDYRSQPA